MFHSSIPKRCKLSRFIFNEDKNIPTSLKAQVTLCRSGGPDLYDLKNRGHRHGGLMKSWQHHTDILEVCSVGKRSAVIGKPVWQSFAVKLCRVGRDCGYDLFMDRFQSCLESETSWDCRTQREGIRGHDAACGHSWTAYGWSWRSDQYNHSKLSDWCGFYVLICFMMCIFICVYKFIF